MEKNHCRDTGMAHSIRVKKLFHIRHLIFLKIKLYKCKHFSYFNWYKSDRIYLEYNKTKKDNNQLFKNLST